jgi:hypothetical protein
MAKQNGNGSISQTAEEQAVADVIEIKEKKRMGTFRRPINEILNDLGKPIPARLLKTKAVQGSKITFIPWPEVVRIMDFYAPGWEGSIIKTEVIHDHQYPYLAERYERQMRQRDEAMRRYEEETLAWEMAPKAERGPRPQQPKLPKEPKEPVPQDQLILTYELAIHAREGTFKRQSTGSEFLHISGWGEVAANAEAQAFKRAAAKFNIGLHLYIDK